MKVTYFNKEYQSKFDEDECCWVIIRDSQRNIIDIQGTDVSAVIAYGHCAGIGFYYECIIDKPSGGVETIPFLENDVLTREEYETKYKGK